VVDRGQLAVDLIAWTQHLLLHGHLAKAEPKTLRYRLLHVAARLTRGQRRLWLRIQHSWPWAHDLAAAFARLVALPVPDRLAFQPDTTSGRSHRQTQHAGCITTPTLGNDRTDTNGARSQDQLTIHE
jgi:hypothetical protein